MSWKSFGSALLIGMLAGAGAVSAQDDRCEEADKIGMVLLTVTSDAPCKLTVNREDVGMLAANEPMTAMVSKEEQDIQCTAPDGKEQAREVRLGGGGCQETSFTVAEIWKRFKEEKNGTVRDTETGLLWKASDNGGDTDWESARKFCETAKARLPTRDELKALHDDSGALHTSCGYADCRVSRKLKLSGHFFWSGTPFETDQMFVVGFTGDRPTVQSAETITAKDVRALCVVGS